MYTDYNEEKNNDEYNEYYSENDNNNNDNGGNEIDKDKIKKIAIFILAFVIFILIIILAAKGFSNKKNNSNSSVSSANQTPAIAIGRESYPIEVGKEVKIYADVLRASIENPVVSWQTEDSSIATVDDSGDGGAIITGISEGTTNVNAYYRQGNKLYSNKCKIIVTSKVVEVENIDIVQSSMNVYKGQTILLQIKVTPEDAPVEAFKFSSDDPSIATVNEKGVVQALEVGTTTIKAETLDGMFSDMMSFTVVADSETQPEVPITGIQLYGLSNGLPVGGTAKVVYSIYPTNATNTVLTWTSSNPGVATIDNQGVLTAVGAGSTIIMATSSTGISSSLNVDVTSNAVPVTGVTIDGDSTIYMSVGGIKKITYTVAPENASNKNATITATDPSIIMVASDGLIGALKEGTTFITVTTEDGQKSAMATVVVSGNGSTGAVSGGESSSESSGGPSSGGSSGGVVDSTTDATCNISSMTTITHNGSSFGAEVSQNNFDQAKKFPAMTDVPVITISNVAACITNLTYTAFWGEDQNSFTAITQPNVPIAVGGTIELNHGNGNYKIQLIGTTANGGSLVKTYYAIVDNTVQPDFSDKVSCTNEEFTFITHNGSGDGAVVSTKNFANASAFKRSNNPIITFSEIASCVDLNSIYVYVYYDSSENGVFAYTYAPYTPHYIKKGFSIDLSTIPHPYLIMRVYGKKASDGTELHKNYYVKIDP